MKPRSLVIALGALVALSCKDDGNTNPIEPGLNNPPPVSGPDLTRKITQGAIKLPQPSAAVAAADEEADLKALSSVTTMAEPGVAPHDPTLPGMLVRCFSGPEFGQPEGKAFRFRTNREHGCELDTRGSDADPNNNAAIVTTAVERLRGRLVEATQRLEFYFAGGPPQGGSPRFSLFIDECKYPTPNDVSVQNASCPQGTSTDGVWDETLFIDVNGCHDNPQGDPYVGAVRPRAPSGQSDPTCTITEAFGGDGVAGTGDEQTYPNFAAYVSGNPGNRYATFFDPARTQRVQNFIISDQPQHYLIYRVNMRAGTPAT